MSSDLVLKNIILEFTVDNIKVNLGLFVQGFNDLEYWDQSVNGLSKVIHLFAKLKPFGSEVL